MNRTKYFRVKVIYFFSKSIPLHTFWLSGISDASSIYLSISDASDISLSDSTLYISLYEPRFLVLPSTLGSGYFHTPVLLHLPNCNHLIWCNYGTKGHDAHSIWVQRNISNRGRHKQNLMEPGSVLDSMSGSDHRAIFSNRSPRLATQDIAESLPAHRIVQS